jgi:phage FluMu protein Com
MPVTFVCQHCRRMLKVTRRKVGMEIHCPKCHGAMTVPTPEEAAVAVLLARTLPSEHAAPPVVEAVDPYAEFTVYDEPPPPETPLRPGGPAVSAPPVPPPPPSSVAHGPAGPAAGIPSAAQPNGTRQQRPEGSKPARSSSSRQAAGDARSAAARSAPKSTPKPVPKPVPKAKGSGDAPRTGARPKPSGGPAAKEPSRPSGRAAPAAAESAPSGKPAKGGTESPLAPVPVEVVTEPTANAQPARAPSAPIPSARTPSAPATSQAAARGAGRPPAHATPSPVQRSSAPATAGPRDAPSPRKPAGRPRRYGDKLLISRRILYVQAVLFAAVGLIALWAGYQLGRAVGPPTAYNPGGAANDVQIQARFTYTTPQGDLATDSGTVLMVLPADKVPQRPIDPAALHPAQPAPGQNDPAVLALEELGGRYARAEGNGTCQMQLPQGGRYHLLYISRQTRRARGESIPAAHVELLNSYFARPDVLIGTQRYVLVTRELRDPKVELYNHFDKSG